MSIISNYSFHEEMILNMMNKPKSIGFSLDTKNSSSTCNKL